MDAREVRKVMAVFSAKLHRPKVMMDDCVKIWREFHGGKAVWHMDRYDSSLEPKWQQMWMHESLIISLHNCMAAKYNLASNGSIYLIPNDEGASDVLTTTAPKADVSADSGVDARDLLQEFDTDDYSAPVSQPQPTEQTPAATA